MTKIIEYKGERLETTFIEELTEQQYVDVKREYYKLPNKKEVINEIATLLNGGVQNTNITNYYFKDLMAKVRVYYNKWSIEDAFDYKPILDTFYAKTLNNGKVFTSENILDNIETAFRLGGKGVASKVANFPIYKVEEILRRYNVNNKWYDMSCGWGARLTTALKKRVDYYGTDPNYLLVDRLEQLNKDWKEITQMKSNVEIRPHGSEVHVNEWENTMGLCFTSPPYFYLEDYKIGEQSWKKGTTYQEWLDNFLKPTIENCHSYLIDKGYLAININNFDKYNLVGDTEKIANSVGFELVEKIVLENISRVNSTGDFNDNDEQIMVFMKKEYAKEHKSKTVVQISLFDF